MDGDDGTSSSVLTVTRGSTKNHRVIPSQRWAVQRDGYGHLYPPSSSTYAWHARQPPYRSAEQSPLRVVAVWGWRQVDDVRVR